MEGAELLQDRPAEYLAFLLLRRNDSYDPALYSARCGVTCHHPLPARMRRHSGRSPTLPFPAV